MTARTQRSQRQMSRHIRRLAATLRALAGVAECAASRSVPVRHFVLWLLGMAETVAGDYVLGLTGRIACQRSSLALARSDAAAALRLAARFRALASALAAFAVRIVATLQAGSRRAMRVPPASCQRFAHACPVHTVERLDSS